MALLTFCNVPLTTAEKRLARIRKLTLDLAALEPNRRIGDEVLRRQLQRELDIVRAAHERFLKSLCMK